MFASLHTAQLTIRQVQKGGTLDRLAETLGRAIATSRQRRQLGRLDDAALHDIDLPRHDAEREAARLPWDLPARRRR